MKRRKWKRRLAARVTDYEEMERSCPTAQKANFSKAFHRPGSGRR